MGTGCRHSQEEIQVLEKIITGAAGAVVAVLIVSLLTEFSGWLSVLLGPLFLTERL